jgi:hypothetical protein
VQGSGGIVVAEGHRGDRSRTGVRMGTHVRGTSRNPSGAHRPGR